MGQQKKSASRLPVEGVLMVLRLFKSLTIPRTLESHDCEGKTTCACGLFGLCTAGFQFALFIHLPTCFCQVWFFLELPQNLFPLGCSGGCQAKQNTRINRVLPAGTPRCQNRSAGQFLHCFSRKQFKTKTKIQKKTKNAANGLHWILG